MPESLPESLPEPEWTQMDVEVAAQAACDGSIPPLELLMRLGPNPPRAYMAALGTRVVQMAEARKIMLNQIADQQAELVRKAGDYIALTDRRSMDDFDSIEEILRRPE